MNKKTNRFICILSLLLYCSAFALGQKNTTKIDFGTVKGSTYINQYFGLALTIPDQWEVQDDETKKQIMALGRQGIAGEDKQLGKALDVSLLNTLNLLTLFDTSPSSAPTFKPSFACIAEKVSQFPSITVRDYLMGMKSLLQKSQMPYKFEREIYFQTIGGREFVVLPTQVTTLGVIIYQNYYSAIMRGYALNFILTYTTEADLKSLEEILKSVKFKR